MTGRGARRLVDRPWPEVGRPVLLVPLGSTEQHGPHLPLDTDAVVASVVCDALAERLTGGGVDAVVAPSIAYGASGEHQDFPGTISIGTEALTTLLVEYGRSACEWAARLVFVNGHGGNVDALAAAVPTLVAEGRPAAWLPCAGAPQGSGPADPHAGRTETSLMLATDPTRVRGDRIEPGNDAPLAELIHRLRTEGVRRVSLNGVLGDPRGSTVEEGARVFDAIIGEAWSRLAGGVVDDRGCLVPTRSETRS
ncbi:mycofactocin biosynthesis peptidyl-dipeptidase MftE [Agromyces sp. H66]|uniref:mycofactocin biosynthesis peptidyl-dipeptidase MftE n=1 Tax=Agromyces sp. H66 TaxID=2529859 RepID=UPI0010AA07DB|nr:mycofactocin biosynthesis peptidyl-dipeptidase MftE [Agromyces sp. H66]